MNEDQLIVYINLNSIQLDLKLSYSEKKKLMEDSFYAVCSDDFFVFRGRKYLVTAVYGENEVDMEVRGVPYSA